MKKAIAHICLLFIFVSQTQIGVIYANETAKIKNEQEQNIKELDAVEGVIDTVIDTLEDKTRSSEIKQQLAEKEKEIEAYIEETQEKISKEGNSEEIQELVQDAKKTVVLKVIAGATKFEDVEENISDEVADTPKEKEEALETITDSLKTESGDYSVIIKTKYSFTKLKSLFGKFDDDTQLQFMYASGDEDYYEVFVQEDSIFRTEMLTDIESGNLPESFIGIEIVIPEVWGITNNSLNPPYQGEGLSLQGGEDLDLTWGIKNYNPANYFGNISTSSVLKVGVVDTGIDHGHPDLQGNANISIDYDFVNDDADAMDNQGHGTHVAGTIGALNNGSGIVGVNPNVNLIGLKICNYRGYCPSYAVIKALDYAKEQKIDILNMSLGGRSNPTDHPICDAITNYTDAGGIVVAASGNSNIDTSQFVPGGCLNSITVAAVDESMTRASFSNYGPKVDVAAPGVNVYSTYPTNKGSYKKLSGTSMATPHIVGLVSVMKSVKPSITSSEIKGLLKSQSVPVSTTASKPIASYAVPEKLINHMINPQVVVVEEEVVEEVVETVVEEVTETDETIDSDTRKDISVIDESIISDKDIQIINLNPDGVEINDTTSDEELIILEEIVEPSPSIQFEGLPEPSDKDVEINSSASAPEIEVVEISETDFDPNSIKKLHISEDGTISVPTGVEINSEDDGTRIPLDVPETSGSGIISADNKTIEINLNGEDDEEGIEINSNEPLIPVELVGEGSSFSGSVDDFTPVEEVIEGEQEDTIKTIDLSSLSSGDSVEINSSISEELKPIAEEVVGELIIPEPIEFEEEGVEINSFGEEEVVDDDAGGFEESGIEINNFGDDSSEDLTSEILGDEFTDDIENEEGGIEINNIGGEEYQFDNLETGEEESFEESEVIEDELLIGEIEGDEESEEMGGIEINSVENIIYERPAKIRYIRDWLSGSNKNGGNFWIEIQAFDRVSGENKAQGKTVIGTRTENVSHPYSRITDGNIATSPYSYGGGSLQNVIVDLGQKQDIGVINIRHYYGDKRTFNRTKTEVSEDGKNWYVLFDSDNEGKYAESAAGKTYVLDETISTLPPKIRYVRDWQHGSTATTSNVWTEIQAIEKTTRANKALGVVPTTDIAIPTGDLSRLTDGSVTTGWTGKSYGNTYSYMKLDLGALYAIDMIKVWHYQDGRTFKKTKTEVSADGIHWYVVFDSDIEGTYAEPKNLSGKTHELRNTITEKPSKIRYIRDHANGSTSNAGSHWIEIQAVDRNGNNVSNGKKVTSKYEQSSSNRPYTWVADGGYSSRTQSRFHNTWMQVDLGAAYELEMLKILHYFGDGRTYFGTKTEISEDGINWFALFDSEKEGTYPEPKDGSGRMYTFGQKNINEVPSNIRYVRDWLKGSDKNGGNFWTEIQAIDRVTGENRALGKVVKGSHVERSTTPYSRITDGNSATSPYAYGGGGLQYVKLDLGAEYPIGMVKVWHYYHDNRTFNKTKTEVSADGVNWYVLFDSDIEGTYIEPKNGEGRTYELRNTISYKPSQVRYIRDHAHGSNRNGGSHWVEIQAFDETGDNVAKGKGVTSKYIPNTSTRPHTRLTDGSLAYWARIASKYQDTWMQVDLGELYDLEILKIWHYYNDGTNSGRIYNDTKTEISADGINWYTLHDSEIDGTYTEPKDGSGKIYRLTDEPIKKSCVINKGKYCSFYLHHANRFDFEVENSSIAGKSASAAGYMITAKDVGKTTYSIKKDGVVYYEIDVEVIPAQVSLGETLEIGEKVILQVPDADRYDISVSNGGLVSLSANSREVHVSSIKAGNTKVYLKYKGRLAAFIDLTIENISQVDLSTVKTESVTVYEGHLKSIEILRLQDYDLAFSEGGFVSSYTSGNILYIRGEKLGSAKIYLRKNRELYMIIDVSIEEFPIQIVPTKCTVFVGGYCDIKLKDADTYTYSTSYPLGTISYARNSSLIRVTGEQVGTSYLIIKNSYGGEAYRIRISVSKDPEIYDVDLYVGQELALYGAVINSTENSKGIFGVYQSPSSNFRNNYLYIKGYSEGSGYANVAGYRLRINVREKPLEYDCQIEVGMPCFLGIHEISQFVKYMDFEIVNSDVIWWRWQKNPNDTLPTEQVAVYGKSEGTGYFRVSGRGMETYDVKINVVPRDTIDVQKTCELDIGGHCKYILRGTGEYTPVIPNSGIVHTGWAHGYFYIYANKEGSGNIYLQKNGVTVYTIGVEVSDIRDLTISFPHTEIEVGTEYEFYVRGNGGYKIFKNSDKLSVYATDNPEKFILESKVFYGFSSINAIDSEGRSDTVTFKVVGGEVEEEGVVQDEIPNEIENDMEELFSIFDLFYERSSSVIASKGVEINRVTGCLVTMSNEECQDIADGGSGKKSISDILDQEKIDILDTRLNNLKTDIRITDDILNLLIDKVGRLGRLEADERKRILIQYVHIGLISNLYERQEGIFFTSAEKRTLQDTFTVYYNSGIESLSLVSENILDSIIEINDQIPYETFTIIGEELKLVGASGIALGGTVCASGVAYASVYSVASDGDVIISGVATIGTCAAGGIIAGEGAIIGGVGLLMESGGKLGKASQSSKASKQDKELSSGEINKLKNNGINIHDLKPKQNGSRFDLFKDKVGDIYYKRKTGHTSTEPQYTGFNINDF